MKPRRMFRPDLRDCVLEGRLPTVISNLGVIVLTTSGYMLLVPFPGAFVVPTSIGNGVGVAVAAGVSGTPINTSYFVLGSGGLSSVQPGNITGVPSLGFLGATSSAAGPAVTINVGSGASDATVMNIPAVTRSTIVNDLLNPPPTIGGPPSGSRFTGIPPEQSYGGTTPASPSTTAPTTTSVETSTSPPPNGVAGYPLFPYPPSVVPLVFPFKPPAGSMFPPASSLPGSFPGGPAPILPITPEGTRPSGPSPIDQE